MGGSGPDSHANHGHSHSGQHHDISANSAHDARERQVIEDDVRCFQLRAPAEAHAKERHRLLDESHAAYERGEKGLAKEFSDAGKRQWQAFEAANAVAADAIFKFKNERVKLEEIELHGLHVSEAVHFVERRLGQDAALASPTVVVIYGAGHHSAGGGTKGQARNLGSASELRNGRG